MVSTSQICSTPINNLQKVSFTSKQPSSNRKVYPGVASVLLPGSGQMMNGEFKKGLGLFGIYVALKTAGMKLGKEVRTVATSSKVLMPKGQRCALGLSYVAMGLVSIGFAAYSGLNAYKHSADDKSTGQNVFKSIASFFIPGSGQMMNGQVVKGLGLLAGASGLLLANIKNIGNAHALVIGCFASTALSLISAVDAYRHNKAVK